MTKTSNSAIHCAIDKGSISEMCAFIFGVDVIYPDWNFKTPLKDEGLLSLSKGIPESRVFDGLRRLLLIVKSFVFVRIHGSTSIVDTTSTFFTLSFANAV